MKSKLKRARQNMNFSVGDVCLRADVPRDTIIQAERGEPVDPEVVQRIAAALINLDPKTLGLKKAAPASPPSHLRGRFASAPLKPG
jgi:transcriptional regulator with XRE-family HTH domain